VNEKKRKAFTLLEICVAAMVMGMALLPIVSLGSASNTELLHLRDRMQAGALLDVAHVYFLETHRGRLTLASLVSDEAEDGLDSVDGLAELPKDLLGPASAEWIRRQAVGLRLERGCPGAEGLGPVVRIMVTWQDGGRHARSYESAMVCF